MGSEGMIDRLVQNRMIVFFFFSNPIFTLRYVKFHMEWNDSGSGLIQLNSTEL